MTGTLPLLLDGRERGTCSMDFVKPDGVCINPSYLKHLFESSKSNLSSWSMVGQSGGGDRPGGGGGAEEARTQSQLADHRYTVYAEYSRYTLRK